MTSFTISGSELVLISQAGAKLRLLGQRAEAANLERIVDDAIDRLAGTL